MYYRVFDHQRGCYFATGYNAKSLDELIKSFKDYILMTNEEEDNIKELLSSWSGISECLQEVSLEWSNEPFEDIEI